MSFKEDGYLIVENVIDTSELYKDAIRHSEEFTGKFDKQAPNSPSFYGEPEVLNMLHGGMLPKMEEFTGLKLFKTYFYWRMYYNSATLETHTDRPACEISGTLFLGGDPWDIFLKDIKGTMVKVSQKPGDLLLYKGYELYHWRKPLIEGDNHAQVFIHYVDQNGPFAWAKDDKITEEPIIIRRN